MFRDCRIIVAGLVFLLVFGMTFGASEQVREVDPLADASVLVEAFVVEVELDALKEAGVSIVGQAPESLSVLKILWCLREKEMGSVVSGAKVCVKNREVGEVSYSKTVYAGNKVMAPDGMVIRSTRYDKYAAEKSFEAQLYLKTDGAIHIEYNYSETGFDDVEDGMQPPNMLKFQLRGTLTAKSGKPLVAGAVQNDDSVKFLIVCATMQSEIDLQKGGKAAGRKKR